MTKYLISVLVVLSLCLAACAKHDRQSSPKHEPIEAADSVTLGAARTDVYLPLLRGKRVGLYSNHTGMVGDRHVLDILVDSGIDVKCAFAPEHGFRGKADAGETFGNDVDERTGVTLLSLYGRGKA